MKFRTPTRARGRDWRHELGPFGRHRSSIAAVTLLAFSSTTLHASVAWAASPTSNDRPSVAVRSKFTQSIAADSQASADVQSRAPVSPPASLRRDTSPPQRLHDASAVTVPKAVTPGFEDQQSAVALANLPQASAPTAAQAISLPGSAASINGMGESFSAQLTTGVATLTIPISFPPARGQAQPALGLGYSSSGGFGNAGVGWSLAGDVFIARQTDRGPPGYDDRSEFHFGQDRFLFGAQELVPICTVKSGVCSGAQPGEAFPAWATEHQYFRARVEGGFSRFFWSPDHRTWRIQSKDGITLELGVALDDAGYDGGLEADPEHPGHIYRWHLVRQYDRHGAPDALPRPQPTNIVQYRYQSEGNIRYLSDVFYTPPAASPHSAEVSKYAHHLRLRWDLRPDATTSYRSGFRQDQSLRLNGIDLASRPFGDATGTPRQMVRRVHLAYAQGLHTSLLETVQVEGECATPVAESAAGELVATACPRLPALRLGYQRGSGPATATDADGLAFEPFNATVQSLGEASPPHSLDEQRVALMDVDADSLPDLVVTAPALFNGKHGLFLNGQRGALGFGSALGMNVSGVDKVDAEVLSLSNANVSPLDPDGDAQIDLVHMPGTKRYSVFTPQRRGGSFDWVGRAITTAAGQDPKIDFTRDSKRIVRADVNADGLVDFVFSSPTEMQTFLALGRLPGGDAQFGHGQLTGGESAELSTEPIRTCVPWSAQPVRFDDPEIRMADMNGDGLPDIVRLRPNQLQYWPGRGNGVWGTGSTGDCVAGTFGQDQDVAVENPPAFGTALSGGLELGDVNGDGLADLVEFRVNAVDIYLNVNGYEFTDRQTLTGVPFKPNSSRYVQITDLDGSGTPDLVWGRAYEYQYVDLNGGKRPYLLTRIDNGLGKVTELEYASSTALMLAARKAGKPWARDMPMSMPVVVRSTNLDQLDKVGRALGRYTTEYSYRDPLFDGIQREFRGFEVADSRTLGDENSPTATTRSTFSLGLCQVTQSGLDTCSPAERWRDNWREATKGLPLLVETFDEHGVYLNSVHNQYELRQLYQGLDGRRVTVAYPSGSETFVYDTASFAASEDSVSLDELRVNLTGITQTEKRDVTRRAQAGTVTLRSSATFDDQGNLLSRTNSGCVSGCAQIDEAVIDTTEPTLVDGDSSKWLFRPARTYVTGSAHTERRNESRFEYDASGDLKRKFVTIAGTLPLDRFRSDGGAVAPAPVGASSGIVAPVEVETLRYERDEFGNVTSQRSPLNRCRDVEFETQYRDLAYAETTFTGALDAASGCGAVALRTTATYDRGWGLLVTSQDMTGQPSRFDYDGFGRLTAKFFADIEHPGQLSALPSSTYEYLLPDDASVAPFSIVIAHQQDGKELNDGSYRDAYSYIDGLGRPLVALGEADPLAGDDGDFVAMVMKDYDAKGATLRAYESFFWTGEGLEFPLSVLPSRGFVSQQHDAFGRPIADYGLDGQVKVYRRYHAVSQDVFDALDLKPGPHQGTYQTSVTDGFGRTVETIERIRNAAGTGLELRQQLSEYLPTGEPIKLTQRLAGAPDVVRWLRYDSIGRLVLNVEPNTAQNYTPDPSADLQSFKAFRYAYNDVGELVGTSDARGCGANYFYDTGGRLLAEDYSPCEATQLPYSPPDFLANTGIETLYRYDSLDLDRDGIVDAAGTHLAPDARFYVGRTVAVADRGARSVIRYDARGRVTGGARQIAKPGSANDSISSRYAPRWYVTEVQLDAAARTLAASTGVTTPELLGHDGTSEVTAEYSKRGQIIEAGSSYGVLASRIKTDPDGRALSLQIGDLAQTQRAFSYDGLRRLKTTQTYRAGPELWSSPAFPMGSEQTRQLSLEDTELSYDDVNNVTAVADYRVPEEWPASAKPVNRAFEYDDLYRLTRTTYDYPNGNDPWTSPYAAENSGGGGAPGPSPHVSFASRVKEQRYRYDHLGNLTQTEDDADGFFDRSLGAQQHGSATQGPHQLVSASNRATAAASARKGDLETRFDAAGNLTGLLLRRDGPCLPAGADCWQRFEYGWDELGRLDRARRWDLRAGEHAVALTDPPPSRAADVELRNTYDCTTTRVLKTAVDVHGNQVHTVYINGSYELRHAAWVDGDFSLSPQTASVYVMAGGVRARVVYSEEDLPSQSSGKQHVFLQIGDQLGSSTATLDQETGELVEFSTYQSYGATESDYRPTRWGSFREPYKFSGKEEDVEVGLSYFGSRFLVPQLGRWASPDPVTIHQLRGDANPYAYVGGRPMMSVDPNGREPITITAILIAAAIGAAIGAASAATIYIATTYDKPGYGSKKWGEGLAVAIGVGAISGALSGAAGGLGATLSTNPVLSNVLGGAIGGFTGSTSSYVGNWVAASARHQNTDDFSAGGAVGAGLIGGGTGVLSGLAVSGVEALYYNIRYPEGTLVPTSKLPAFKTEAAARQYWADRFGDATYYTGREFSAGIFRDNAGGFHLTDTLSAGGVSSGTDHLFASNNQLVAHIHSHPSGGVPSFLDPENESGSNFSNAEVFHPGSDVGVQEWFIHEGKCVANCRAYLVTPEGVIKAGYGHNMGEPGNLGTNRGFVIGSVSPSISAPAVGASVAGSMDAVRKRRSQFDYPE
jgi:RHS repeat-associated protein